MIVVFLCGACWHENRINVEEYVDTFECTQCGEVNYIDEDCILCGLVGRDDVDACGC